jgi:hypothetical protein
MWLSLSRDSTSIARLWLKGGMNSEGERLLRDAGATRVSRKHNYHFRGCYRAVDTYCINFRESFIIIEDSIQDFSDSEL